MNVPEKIDWRPREGRRSAGEGRAWALITRPKHRGNRKILAAEKKPEFPGGGGEATLLTGRKKDSRGG